MEASYIFPDMQALPRLREFKTKEVANIMWGLATLRDCFQLDEASLRRLDTTGATCIMEHLPAMSSEHQHMANVVWGFAHLRLDPLDGRWV